MTTRVQGDSGGMGRGWAKGRGFQKEGNQRPSHGRRVGGQDSRKTSISFPLTRTVSVIVIEQPYRAPCLRQAPGAHGQGLLASHTSPKREGQL